MKQRLFVFSLICFVAICKNLAQGIQAPSKVEELYALIREDLDWRETRSDAPIAVLFFDINHDGILEALGSLQEDIASGGCHGNGWYLYRFKNGKWQQSLLPNGNDPSYDPVFARGDDFFSLTEKGQKPKLILVYSAYGRTLNDPTYDWDISHIAWEITMDGGGYLKTIPIPELTTNIFGIFNVDKEYIECDWQPPEIYKKLVPLPLGVPQPLQDDEGKAENKTSRLLLYAGILFLILAVIYFVRRTKQ